MSKLATVILWVAALALAAFIVLRAGRRKDRLLLSGRLSPRLVRMIAVLIVWFGWRPDGAVQAAPPEVCTTIPPRLPPPLPPGHFAPPPVPIKIAPFTDIAAPELGSRAQHAFREALSAAPGDVAKHLAAAEQYARMAEARVATIAEVGMPEFRPWMSKAARPVGRMNHEISEEYRAVFDKKLASASAGTWDTEGVLDVTVVSAGGAELERGQVASALKDGVVVRFRRLDLLRAAGAPLVLRHATLGEIVVPAGRVLASWQLPEVLSAPARAHIDALVRDAGTCGAAAQRALELVLPAAHTAIRAALAQPSGEPAGAPALRLLLSLYDE